MRRKLLTALAAAAMLLVGAEGFARFHLGLGDPPLTVRDAEIDYMFAPSRTYSRFGNRVSYNADSMRSDEFPREKTSGDEVRILVMGDSVVNGGALTDQDDLATVILQRRLREDYGINAIIGNISAGSWGPGNPLAYTERFGWFDADLAFIVLSSHGLGDVPTFPDDLGPEFPESTPLLALQEAVVRYLPASAVAVGAAAVTDRIPGRATGKRYLHELFARAKEAVPHVIVLLHPTQHELAHGMDPDGDEILSIAKDGGLSGLAAADRMGGDASVFYRDDIHLDVAGQRLYGALLLCQALVWLNPPVDNACGTEHRNGVAPILRLNVLPGQALIRSGW